jgi:raffinose/stachyose/melibiose transport system permease protein
LTGGASWLWACAAVCVSFNAATPLTGSACLSNRRGEVRCRGQFAYFDQCVLTLGRSPEINRPSQASVSNREAATAFMTNHDAMVRRPTRWHIAVFLAPAVLVYTLVMIVPLFGTLQLSLFRMVDHVPTFVGLDNFRTLFTDPRWSASFWNALWNNVWFFIIHMLVQNPIGVLLAALLSSPKLRFRAFYRTAIFVPTILSFVIVGFVWKLILSPLWGVAPSLLDLVGLKSLFTPWLGKEEYALTTLGLISVWQFVGIPMMLIYAAMLSIPDEVIEAAEMDGITGMAQFWKIKLPLILPSIGIISILTFVGNFNAFDLIYTAQGALAGPNFSTDILGTFLYRTFFGFQLQLGDTNMGATIASMMFFIILAGVCLYLLAVQTRLRRYQF